MSFWNSRSQEIYAIGKDVTYQCVVMIVYIVYLPQEYQLDAT